MRHTVEHASLVNNKYFTLNIGDIIIGIEFDALVPPDKIVVFRIDKTGRDF